MNDDVIMIPIAEIHVLNPRQRDQKKFEVIVNSIKTLGLKMPIANRLLRVCDADCFPIC